MNTNQRWVPLGYQQITGLGSAANLTVPAGATMAIVTVDGATSSVRYRDDGTAPTSSIGVPLSTGSTLEYSGTLSAIQFIGAGGSPILNILYYRAA